MKLGIIGSGMIVNELLSFIKSIKEIELEAILGRIESKEKIEKLCNDYNIKRAYYDYDELLNSDIHTVYIALPNHLHYEYCKKALLKGKHVICEKPFTSNINELKELITIALNNDCLLFEAITNQYLPNYQIIKNNLNKLGNIKIISCNYSQYSSRYNAFKQGNILPAFDINKSGGALMDLNVYNIHFIVGLFGKPTHVQYYANIKHDIDTSGILTLIYPDFKCICIGAKDCNAPIISTIQGDNGCLKIIGPTSLLQEVELIENNNEITKLPTPKVHRMYDEFMQFTNAINNLDYDLCSKMLKHSLIVMDVLTKARASANIIFPGE